MQNIETDMLPEIEPIHMAFKSVKFRQQIAYHTRVGSRVGNFLSIHIYFSLKTTYLTWHTILGGDFIPVSVFHNKI